MITLTIAAALLLQTGAASVAPPPRDTVPVARRDTIRLGGPPGAPPDTLPARRDTFRVGRDTLRLGTDSGRATPRPIPTAPSGPTGPVSDSIFDSPATRALVERVIRAGTTVPAELRDYRARMYSRITLSVRADSSEGGESPVTVDEMAGEVRWTRAGLEQRIRGHRVRMLSPTPYTIGTVLEAPWVVPHLYGNTIDVFSLAATPGGRSRVSSAIHPFSWRGLDVYRYEAGDTVRVRTSQGTVTLVPIVVRPRASAPPTAQQTVAGTFHVDADRAAVARARFGFTDREGRFLVTETGTFFELENGLVENRWWLPVRQRREVQIGSPLLGGNVAIRMVTVLSGFDPNTGWTPAERGGRLVWDVARGDSVFEGYARALGRADEADIADFADLREAVRPPDPDAGPVRVGVRYERGEHLFRYNRVEGAFLGLAARAEPRDVERRAWSLYGTAGYAISEGAVRGEASARWHPRPASELSPQYIVAATGYRRLMNTQAFRPAFAWELGYALGAALGGYDVRDYYDATGGELQLTRRRGPFTARLTGRYESQDSVSRNTESFLFGEARDFPVVADAEPGNHAAVEGELRWQRGAGAFSIGSSLVAALRGEAGFGDFRTQRVTALLSTRRTGKYVTFLARGDAGVVVGEAPPQFLFRFGGTEGLRGYERNEFAGSTALLGRGRLLLHLPPYGNEPLFRAGFFAFPPLRAALVLSGDAGRSDISDDSRPSLDRLFSQTTDGWRTSYGLGLSLFEDAVAFEHVWPGGGGEGKWYIGFVSWF
jgi:hypothetical protein